MSAFDAYDNGPSNLGGISPAMSPTRPLRGQGQRRRYSTTTSVNGLNSSHDSLSISSGGDRDEASVVYSDRFIPSRDATNLDGAFDNLNIDGDLNRENEWASGVTPSGGGSLASPGHLSSELARENLGAMNSLLRSELLGIDQTPSSRLRSSGGRDSSIGGGVQTSGELSRGSAGSGKNVFKFKSDRRRSSGEGSLGSSSSGGSFSSVDSPSSSSSSFGALASGGSLSNLNMLGSPSKKAMRKISKTPYKILDAPALQDDYYLNLVDWSCSNILSVALGSSVYLWSAYTSKVTKLMDVGEEETVSSICWSPKGTHVAIGSSNGAVQIWDAQAGKMTRELAPHASRVGTLAWSASLLATGSRDRSIFLQDARIPSNNHSNNNSSGSANGSDGAYSQGSSTSVSHVTSTGTTVTTSINFTADTETPGHGGGSGGDGVGESRRRPGDACIVHRLTAHRQEVCGLKWSPDEKMLASGGNDNKLCVWATNHADPREPICRFNDHIAAVKAVAWSPHQNGLLASGGGTADRNIRFWNANTGVSLHRVDTGSQVCNLMWSTNVNEIVSTHGYSLNQIIVWRYPSMQKLATLTGHSLRVLYLAMSPDGQSVVTGAGDETLRFWNIFPGPRTSRGAKGSGILFPSGDIR